MQTETNNVTGHVFKAKIKWIDDCGWQLSDIKEAIGFSDTLKSIWIDKVVTIKIIEAKKNYCVYEGSMTGVSMKIIDTFWVLK